MSGRDRGRLLMAAVMIGARLLAGPAHHGSIGLAYIGPGAGFAFLGSFLTLLVGFFLSLASLVAWPFRVAWRLFRGRTGYRHAKIRKLIFLGLDGFDPALAEKFMAAGKLPNLRRLRDQGGYRRLRTTFPPLSPVAWSTFATGVSPAKHSMFDFLNRNLRSYMPELSSARVREPRRILRIGKYRIPLSAPVTEMRRKSRTFWKILGEHFITSTILRVPITFPPEQFNGRVLSAMCTPDLLGTQGTFTLFTTNNTGEAMEGGNRSPLTLERGLLKGEVPGPFNSMVKDGGPLVIPFTLEVTGKDKVILSIGEERHELSTGEYSRWIPLVFTAALRTKVKGIARFLLTQTESETSLYMTPVNIDPENPALPISHPSKYAAYLAKLLGTYSTLGMAEDTWALNEHAIDEDAFLQQAYLTCQEREAMFLSALDRSPRGVVACVFDTTDRVQHMFFRQMREGGQFGGVIEDLYRRADELVGKAAKYVDDDTVLFVLSDHGFASFERGVNLNTWFLENGYLALKEGASGKDFLKDVDWSGTRAYTFGLAGIYLNLKGREEQGIVKPSECEALKQEIAAKLTGLTDHERNKVAIRHAWPSNSLYQGPYLDAAPDLIIGYGDGYRASWDAAVGKVSPEVIVDNPKQWSGDHCIDPGLVPGVLFSNRPIDAEDPGIEDMAPTALALFGVEQPAYMEGHSVFHEAVRPASTEVAA